MHLNEALALANAALTAIALTLMCAGFLAIRRKRVTTHRRLMLAAFVACLCFLVTFVFRIVRFGLTPFQGEGIAEALHLLVFAIHDGLAVVTIPLVLVSLASGLLKRLSIHREVAPIALLVWGAGAVTGLMLYALLYPTGTAIGP